MTFLTELAHILHFICGLEGIYRNKHRIGLKLKHILSRLAIILKAHLDVRLGTSLFDAIKRALVVMNGNTAEVFIEIGGILMVGKNNRIV